MHLFKGLRPAITCYNAPYLKIITNGDCKTGSGATEAPAVPADSVVACYYQNIYGANDLILHNLTLGKLFLDENMIYPIRYWFYELCTFMRMARKLSYKMTNAKFPVPVFEDQLQTNFFTIALIIISNLEAIDGLLYSNFKPSVLKPLLLNFQTSDGPDTIDFNRFLLHFILTLGITYTRYDSVGQLKQDIKQFIGRAFESCDNVAAALERDLAAFPKTFCPDNAPDFDLFHNMAERTFVHAGRSYTWTELE